MHVSMVLVPKYSKFCAYISYVISSSFVNSNDKRNTEHTIESKSILAVIFKAHLHMKRNNYYYDKAVYRYNTLDQCFVWWFLFNVCEWVSHLWLWYTNIFLQKINFSYHAWHFSLDLCSPMILLNHCSVQNGYSGVSSQTNWI